ncbi:MAG: hypothetical protein ACTHJT_13615 [Cytophaga sp.]|uniref:hypothetical protein n=1 Tax=Cytophaga sp. TaxID=29535 RepID=UPI003F81F8FC
MEKYWEIILSTIALIGGLALLGMRSYIVEKVKNIATHEDIGKITNQIESAKQQLSILTNKHNVLFNEEKEALVAYMSSWNVWYGSIRVVLTDYNENNYTSITELKPTFKKDYDKMQIAMSKVELFVDNEELITLIRALNKETYKLHKINLEYTNKIYVQYYYIKVERKKMNDMFANHELPQKVIQQRLTTLASIIFDYNAIIPAFYKNITDIKFDFIKHSKTYIRRGVNEEYSNQPQTK